MAKIYFNTRDEMTCVDTDMVALVMADGNYSKVYYINGREIGLTFGISKLEQILKDNNNRRNRFVRLGRSYIVNHYYVYKIELLKQVMTLSDGGKGNLRLTLPKQTLKSYKNAIDKRYKQQTND